MKILNSVALLVIILSFSSVLEAKVKHVAEHGFIVENTFTTSSSPENVWHALVNDIDKWWPKDHSWWGEKGTFTVKAQAGGCFCETAGINSAEHMRISFVEPNKLLRMTGGLGPLQGMGVYGSLDWAISKVGNDTMVVLKYSVTGISESGFEKLAPIVDKVQSIQLNRLKAFL